MAATLRVLLLAFSLPLLCATAAASKRPLWNRDLSLEDASTRCPCRCDVDPRVEQPSDTPLPTWCSDPGRQRAVFQVDAPGDVILRLPWRRQDGLYMAKPVRVIKKETTHDLPSTMLQASDAEGVLLFHAPTAGVYLVYYQPLQFQLNATCGCRRSRFLTLPVPAQKRPVPPELPQAQLLSMESYTPFDERTPWEKTALPSEATALRAAVGGGTLFTAVRVTNATKHAARWRRSAGGTPPLALLSLPHRSDQPVLLGSITAGTVAVVQAVVWAASALSDMSISCSAFIGESSNYTMPAAYARALSGSDVPHRDYRGNVVQSGKLSAAVGELVPLLLRINFPRFMPMGSYSASFILSAEGLPDGTMTLPVQLLVLPAPAGDTMESDAPVVSAAIGSGSRLSWLDSSTAQTGLPPVFYPPPRLAANDSNIIRWPDRSVTLPPPSSPSAAVIQQIRVGQHDLLSKAIALKVTVDNAGSNGAVKWQADAPARRPTTALPRADWAGSLSSKDGALQLTWAAHANMEGAMRVNFRLSALRATTVANVQLPIELNAAVCKLMAGLGSRGGALRDSAWRTSEGMHAASHSVWLGSAAAGLRLQLMGRPDDESWATTAFAVEYGKESDWWGEHAGMSVAAALADGNCAMTAFTGARELVPGRPLELGVLLMPSPYRLGWQPLAIAPSVFRSYMPGADEWEMPSPAVLQSWRITHITIPTGTQLNRWVNYPFHADTVHGMLLYVDTAHRHDVEVSFDYSNGLLSAHAEELPLLAQLSDHPLATPASQMVLLPALVSSEASGSAWLLQRRYSNLTGGPVASLPERMEDPALYTRCPSRWDNFYIEGAYWVLRNFLLDGLHLSSANMIPQTARRLRRLLNGHKRSRVADVALHGSMMRYHLLIPFVQRGLLRAGELPGEEASAEEWLVEASGVPFGLRVDMLGEGNAYKAMLFGMTSRCTNSGLLGRINCPSAQLWDVLEAFGLQQTSLLGWWLPSPPAVTSDARVKASVYLQPGKRALIALASWEARETLSVTLTIDWQALGFAATPVSARRIPGFQAQLELEDGETILVPPGKGALLEVGQPFQLTAQPNRLVVLWVMLAVLGGGAGVSLCLRRMLKRGGRRRRDMHRLPDEDMDAEFGECDRLVDGYDDGGDGDGQAATELADDEEQLLIAPLPSHALDAATAAAIDSVDAVLDAEVEMTDFTYDSGSSDDGDAGGDEVEEYW